MSRLFWKIFLSFWLSLVLFAGASFWAASHYLERTRAQGAMEHPRAHISAYIQEAQSIVETQGIEGLKAWVRKLDRYEAVPFLLIDADGKELLERPISPRVEEKLRRTLRPQPRGDRRTPRRRPLLIKSPGGEAYQLVPDFQSVTLGRILSRPRVMAIPIIIAAMVSGVVGFLLAQYLTRPIRRLSRATHRYALGDLGLRVGSTMGRRRDELADLAHDFDQMAEKLEQLLGSQKQLLTDVAHELRSPLARMQVVLGLARQRSPNQSQVELDRIEREADRLNDLISQLLSLTRLESGAVPPQSESIDLTNLLEEIVENADFEARAKNRQVRIVQSVPAIIEANEELLRSAVENIIRNAMKYTDENTSVDVSLQLDPEHTGWLLVHVRDHGPGVPNVMLAKLFEPFVRVDNARDRKRGGYGLGLAIADRAIRVHRGKISLLNEPKGGLKVTICLPIDQARSRKRALQGKGLKCFF